LGIRIDVYENKQYNQMYRKRNSDGYWIEKEKQRPTNEHGQIVDKNGNILLKKVIQIETPHKCPKDARVEFRIKLAMDKRVAQSVANKEEYNALWKRIDREDYDYIIKNDLIGQSLVSWANNTRTSQEYYNLLRYK
jgi:ribosomal protein L24